MIELAGLAVIPVLRNRIRGTGMSVRLFGFYAGVTFSTLVASGFAAAEGFSRTGIHIYPSFKDECSDVMGPPLPGDTSKLLPLEKFIHQGARKIVLDTGRRASMGSANSYAAGVIRKYEVLYGGIEVNIRIIASDKRYLNGERIKTYEGEELVDCRAYFDYTTPDR